MFDSPFDNPFRYPLTGPWGHGQSGVPGDPIALWMERDGLQDSIGESTITFVGGSAADLMAAEINFSGAAVEAIDTLSGGNLFSVGGVEITRTGQEWYEILLPNPYVHFSVNGGVGYNTAQSSDNIKKINKYLHISNNYSTFITDYFTPTSELVSAVYYNVSTTYNWSLRYGLGNARYVNVLFTSSVALSVGANALKMQKIWIDRSFAGINSTTTPPLIKNGFATEFSSVVDYYGGKSTYDTTAGKYFEATFVNADTVGIVSTAVSTLYGMAVVEINGDKTLASSLPTAQQLVDIGMLADTVLIANGGTLHPTDRIFDQYSLPANLPRIGNKTNIFNYTEFAKDLPVGTYTVRVTITGYKRAAATQIWISVMCLTGGSNDYKINSQTVNVYVPETIMSYDRPVWDMSYSTIPTGASVAEWMGHDGSEKVSVAPALWIDGEEKTPTNGVEYFGYQSASMKMTNNLRHSQTGSTNIGTVEYEYAIAPVSGLTISHTLQWLTTGVTSGYPCMMDLSALHDKYNTVGNTEQSEQTGDFLDSSGNMAWSWDTDGKTAVMIYIPDIRKTVNNWVEAFGGNMYWHKIAQGWCKLYAGRYTMVPIHDFISDETIECVVNFRFGYYPEGANTKFSGLVL